MNKISLTYFKDISFLAPEENIFYDEVLWALAEEGKLGNTLRVWESPVHFIVLGRTGKVSEDILAPAVKTNTIPVLRRTSGGGTVIQGPGCLNFSFIVSKDEYPALSDLRRSYIIILEGVLNVLKKLGVDAVFKPISDLTLVEASAESGSEYGERKFSGNAQRRGRKFILHHGTILYNFDLPLMSQYLAMPKDIPEYRRGRPHEQFVTNIPIISREFKMKMLEFYGTPTARYMSQVSGEEGEMLKKFSGGSKTSSFELTVKLTKI